MLTPNALTWWFGPRKCGSNKPTVSGRMMDVPVNQISAEAWSGDVATSASTRKVGNTMFFSAMSICGHALMVSKSVIQDSCNGRRDAE